MDVGIIFLGWFLAIALGFGLLLMAVYRAQANGKGMSDEDWDRYTTAIFVDRYDNSNFGNKVAMLLLLGSTMLAIMFFPFMYGNKDEDKE